MRTFLRHRLARRNEAGIAALLVAFFTIALFLPLAAISVDVARMYIEVDRVQTAADAAALAGVTYLPGDLPDATTAALAAAAKNGYTPSATSTVTVGLGARPTQLKVTVSSTIPNTFASTFGQPDTTITRSSVADYNGPAPMGSPCNTFGNEPAGSPGAGPATSQLSVPAGATCSSNPQFWADAQGPNSYKTQGDRYNTRYCQGKSSLSNYGEYGCNNTTTPKKNTDFDPLGDFYIIRVGATAVNYPLTIQLYDPEYVGTGANCTAAPTRPSNSPSLVDLWNLYATLDATVRYALSPNSFCTGDDPSAVARLGSEVPVVTSFGLRQPTDSYVPSQAPIETQCTPKQYPGYTAAQVTTDTLRRYKTPSKPADGLNTASYSEPIARLFHQWVTFCTFTPTHAGDYYLQVRTDVQTGGTPETTYGGAWTEGNMAVLNQTGDDPSVMSNTSNAFAIRAVSTQAGSISVAGWDHMTIYANATGASTTFNLVRVIPAAAGETLTLSFFDVGDAATSGTLTILPPTESSITLTGCTGKGPQPKVTTTVALTGCSVKNINGGDPTTGWNGGLEEISVPIPNGYTCNSTSNGGCWFRVLDSFGTGSVHDVTTWTALIQGDPVRLIQ